MLELIDIVKIYKTKAHEVHALKGVSLSFRDNEFVSVLGPSGCGKTTLLNLIGGLDSYTDGDLIINGKSTRQYKNKDWDVYRNHRIGFIFQSYNLIPHQTVLNNVALALTIAGVEKKERIARATAVLEKVGLSDQLKKKPNQLSGGQCQRVAIARALVNDPEILLADEPTGALDSTTSVQIMELIKEIAKERLVVMVTHNPELAEKYSTRIIQLKDGELVGDTNPFNPETETPAPKVTYTDVADLDTAVLACGDPTKVEKPKKKKEKAKMSFLTAFKLSLNNLLTKKRRTALIAIASSIGIIGVALVLSISWGVNLFISRMQNDMIAGNPITVQEQVFDIDAFIQGDGAASATWRDVDWADGRVNVNETIRNLVVQMNAMDNVMRVNEITQDYIDFVMDFFNCEERNPSREHLAAVFLDYGLNLSHNFFLDFSPSINAAQAATTPDTISLAAIRAIYTALLEASGEFSEYAPFIDSLSSPFMQMTDNEEFLSQQFNLVDGEITHRDRQGNITDTEVVNGRWATEANELMIVLNRGTRRVGETETTAQPVIANHLSDLTLAQLGFLSQNEFMNIVFDATRDMHPTLHEQYFSPDLVRSHIRYSDILDRTFYYIPNDLVFSAGHSRLQDTADRAGYDISMVAYQLVQNANEFEFDLADLSDAELEEKGIIPLRIVGILEPREDVQFRSISSGLFYTEALRDKIFTREQESPSSIVERLRAGDLSSGIMGRNPLTDDSLWMGAAFNFEFLNPYRNTDGMQPIPRLAPAGEVNPMAGMMNMIGGFLPGLVTGDVMQGLALRTLNTRQLGGEWLASALAIYPSNFNSQEVVRDFLDTWNSDEALTFRSSGRRVTVTAQDRADTETLLGAWGAVGGEQAIAIRDSLTVNRGIRDVLLGQMVIWPTTDDIRQFSIVPTCMHPDCPLVSGGAGAVCSCCDCENNEPIELTISRQNRDELIGMLNFWSVLESAFPTTAPTIEDIDALLETFPPMPGLDVSEMRPMLETLVRSLPLLGWPMESFPVPLSRSYTLSPQDIAAVLDAISDFPTHVGYTIIQRTDVTDILLTRANLARVQSVLDAYNLDPSSNLIATISGRRFVMPSGDREYVQERISGHDWGSGVSLNFVIGEGEMVTLTADERSDITYSDFLWALMTMMRTLLNAITFALIGFTALSLIVSTVMIAIITYVSVVERKKEIGVIRSLGGRRLDVAYLFNTETFMIGLISGLFAIFVTWLGTILVNFLVGLVEAITIAVFPWWMAIAMVGLSIFLAMISGLIPSYMASKKDPVVALRSE